MRKLNDGRLFFNRADAAAELQDDEARCADCGVPYGLHVPPGGSVAIVRVDGEIGYAMPGCGEEGNHDR